MELIIMFSYNIQTIIAKFLKFKVKVFFCIDNDFCKLFSLQQGNI